MTATNPEIGQTLSVNGINTNYHDVGAGSPVLLIHGSGPGVSGWANWRLTIPALATSHRVIVPDIVGFGFTQRPADFVFGMDGWVAHLLGVLDTLGIEKADVVGNSFGGALSLAMAIRHPDRINRLILMGSAGLRFPLTAGLDAVWGYTPSVENMKKLLDIFAYDRALVTDELAELRYRASIRPGVQESFSAMFPAPRQNGVDALASDEVAIAAITHRTLIFHGRDDRVIPLEASERLHRLIKHSQMHVFGECGHWTQIEKATAFNLLVNQFLDGAI